MSRRNTTAPQILYELMREITTLKCRSGNTLGISFRTWFLCPPSRLDLVAKASAVDLRSLVKVGKGNLLGRLLRDLVPPPHCATPWVERSPQRVRDRFDVSGYVGRSLRKKLEGI